MEKLFQKLDGALQTGQFLLARALVRFFCDAQNACVIFPSSIVALLETLVSVLDEDDADRARGRFVEEREEGELARQRRKDTYADMVLSSLPWIGKDLAERKPADLERIMAKIDHYMRLVEERACVCVCVCVFVVERKCVCVVSVCLYVCVSVCGR